ncbi:putative SOS response-associated peptidase YedK [Bradyrhizobium sp. USDA 4538]|nr:putative SOS response-associated peptidase YedK [Bradyrhizobium sp. USDA 4538]MCP1906939.1 putative SOS response-associated peptidase YedK [Bradyrhizobium sp. USDA 4537]MCP1985414.1 putative SOS response-associated peptidase YedK [Bradyrhizobium sp. USDA 4539]
MKEFYQKDRHRKRKIIAHEKGDHLCFAGIWENWRDPDTGEWERTFAILTVKADELIARVHHRMPLFLDKLSLYRWMSADGNPHDLLSSRPATIPIVVYDA